jgi:hypothetical protein
MCGAVFWQVLQTFALSLGDRAFVQNLSKKHKTHLPEHWRWANNLSKL